MTSVEAKSDSELRVLGEILQIIGDVRGEKSTFAAVASKVSEHFLGGSELVVYALDQKSLMFRQVFPQSENAMSFKVRNLTLRSTSEVEIQQIFLRYFASDAENSHPFIQPVFSLDVLRAVVLLRHKQASSFSDSDRAFIATSARTLLWVLERERLLQLFKEMQ